MKGPIQNCCMIIFMNGSYNGKLTGSRAFLVLIISTRGFITRSGHQNAGTNNVEHQNVGLKMSDYGSEICGH